MEELSVEEGTQDSSFQRMVKERRLLLIFTVSKSRRQIKNKKVDWISPVGLGDVSIVNRSFIVWIS